MKIENEKKDLTNERSNNFQTIWIDYWKQNHQIMQTKNKTLSEKIEKIKKKTANNQRHNDLDVV